MQLHWWLASLAAWAICGLVCAASHLLVVVQDDNHVGVQEAGMVHGLVRHATSDGTVTNDLQGTAGGGWDRRRRCPLLAGCHSMRPCARAAVKSRQRTATTLFFRPLTSRPTAMPSAAEMEVELCPAPNGS